MDIKITYRQRITLTFLCQELIIRILLQSEAWLKVTLTLLFLITLEMETLTSLNLLNKRLQSGFRMKPRTVVSCVIVSSICSGVNITAVNAACWYVTHVPLRKTMSLGIKTKKSECADSVILIKLEESEKIAD